MKNNKKNVFSYLITASTLGEDVRQLLHGQLLLIEIILQRLLLPLLLLFNGENGPERVVHVVDGVHVKVEQPVAAVAVAVAPAIAIKGARSLKQI